MDDAVEQLVPRDPGMFFGPDKDLRARTRTLDRGVEEAKANRLPGEHEDHLRRILSRQVIAFWRALRGDPHTRLESM